MSRFDEALDCLEARLELSPHPWREHHTLMLLALVRDLRGEHEDALNICRRALVVLSDYPYTIIVKVDALVKLGRPDEAAKVYRRLSADSRARLKPTLELLCFRDERLRVGLLELLELAASQLMTEKPHTTFSVQGGPAL